ncbi:MAG: sulfatase-like hydrolase/transferase [Planctomycetota bacterium]
MKRLIGLALHCLSAALLPPILTDSADAGDEPMIRPNILWISCEDISPLLGCYGDITATTPNLDRLASEGARFTHAFSCHGVCAPSRTGIITGMFPTSLGANHMRSKAGVPDHIRLFPQLLREAGYYCTNNSKTDYNLMWDQRATWDASSARAHWKNRPTTETPFFSVFNLTMTHESKVWPSGWSEIVKDMDVSLRHQPDRMVVPPLYPNTAAVREDFARLADLITVMDNEVGRLLRELDDAGLSESTIVMFWSDHGNGLPRAKRWTYDSGSHVPLIVRVPEPFRAMAGIGEPGADDFRMVSLLDLGPTVLNLAGIRVPEFMHGKPFLGPGRHGGHDFVFGARDRLDERFDMVRTVRNRRFRYVRNFMPWRPALQHVAYGETNETLKEMRRLRAAGELGQDSAQWFEVPRAAEELYDLEKDPWELHNLAEESEHQTLLEDLRNQLDAWQIETRDVHLLPEIMLDETQQANGERWSLLQGDDGRIRIARILNAARQAAGLEVGKAPRRQSELDADPAVRWWQVALAARAADVQDRLTLLRQEAQHSDRAIRITAAGGMARAGLIDEAAEILRPLALSQNEFIRHAAVLEIDEAGPEMIRLATAELKSLSNQDHEYTRRLAVHALQSIGIATRPESKR